MYGPALALTLVAAQAGDGRQAAMEAALRFDLPEPALDGVAPRSLWATHYNLPVVAHEPSGFPLRTLDDRELGPRLTRRHWCDAAMEGSVVVEGHGVFNFSGTKPNVEVDCTPIFPRHPAVGRSRFGPARGPFGDGVRNMVLVPLRTIAVDPETIAFGSLVYVPDARGTIVQRPDGTSAPHDGWFYAADRGGAIRGTHIDVFVGTATTNPFGFVRSRRNPPFSAYVIDHDQAERVLAAAHR